jgi:hypothetical protein
MMRITFITEEMLFRNSQGSVNDLFYGIEQWHDIDARSMRNDIGGIIIGLAEKQMRADSTCDITRVKAKECFELDDEIFKDCLAH